MVTDDATATFGGPGGGGAVDLLNIPRYANTDTQLSKGLVYYCNGSESRLAVLQVLW